MDTPFTLKSLNGINFINRKCLINVLNHTSTFYLLNNLKTFDGIIGYDFLKEIGAKIDIDAGYLHYQNSYVKLQYLCCNQVNLITINEDSVPDNIRSEFHQLINNNTNAFAHPDRALPYNTNVEATISTTTDDPIFSKSYPYPMSATEFINSEIKSLLKDGIIRKSSSPYNSPVHVVTKKALMKMASKSYGW